MANLIRRGAMKTRRSRGVPIRSGHVDGGLGSLPSRPAGNQMVHAILLTRSVKPGFLRPVLTDR